MNIFFISKLLLQLINLNKLQFRTQNDRKENKKRGNKRKKKRNVEQKGCRTSCCNANFLSLLDVRPLEVAFVIVLGIFPRISTFFFKENREGIPELDSTSKEFYRSRRIPIRRKERTKSKEKSTVDVLLDQRSSTTIRRDT